MSVLWSSIKNAYFSYSDQACNLVFLFIGIVYFLIKYKNEQRSLLIYEIFGILLLVTPGVANVILKENEASWVVYGFLCVPVVMAYIGTDIFSELPQKKSRIVWILMCILFLQAGNNLRYSGAHWNFSWSQYGISDELQVIADEIDFLEKPRVLAPTEVSAGLRKYDTKFAVLYGEGLSYTPQNMEQLRLEAESYGCNCVIVEAVYDNAEELNDAGYSKISTTEHYVVYVR